MVKDELPGIPAEVIEKRIYLIRGHRVMLDTDLAFLYDVPTKQLVQAVKRNKGRFPDDFMFQMTQEEWNLLVKRFAAEAKGKMLSFQESGSLRSQIVTSSFQAIEYVEFLNAPGGRRTPPFCFTEQGVPMLSAVLRSPRAIAVSFEVVRTFVKLRQMLAGNLELARRLSALEEKYDEQFKSVFDAIRSLMEVPDPKKKGKLGF